MCDFFDDFGDGEFMNDGFDYGMEDSAESDFDDNLDQNDDQHDGFDIQDAYWSGVGLGFWYEEARRERRKRKETDPDDPSDID